MGILDIAITFGKSFKSYMKLNKLFFFDRIPVSSTTGEIKMKNKKFMVIGIDGVPYELVDKYSKENIMPNIKRAINKHGLKKMKVPLPEISSVSWTSFMTGVNPGMHGVYGFMELNNNSYSYRFPSFKSFPEKTIWEKLKNKSIILNLPNTYPARPMNGILVSGFFALDLKQSVYPESLYSYLNKIDYRVDVDTSYALKEEHLFFKELKETLLLRFELYKKFKDEIWDLFFFIITGTDRLHHFFFDSWDNPKGKHYKQFIEYYKLVDEIIGVLIDDMDKAGTPYLILSDHGFEKIKYEVYLNQYLKDWKYLSIDTENPKNLKHISDNSSAFVLDPSRVYIHLKNKYKKGIVSQKDKYKILTELKQKFLTIEIEGETVIENAYFKEELYRGKYIDNAPDMVLRGKSGFDLKAGITKKEKFAKTHLQGKHSWNNAIVIDSYGLDIEDYPYIHSVGNKIENYFLNI
jgi:predicted AlkP superfamily phosphohydrolase/phosphomutase